MSTQATVSVQYGKVTSTLYRVTGVTVTNGGSGYTGGSISFSSTSAAATPNFSGGALQSVTVTNDGANNSAFGPSATVSAPNVTPVNNNNLVAISNQLGLGGSLLNAANQTYLDSNAGTPVTIGATPNLVQLQTLVRE